MSYNIHTYMFECAYKTDRQTDRQVMYKKTGGYKRSPQ